MSDKVEQAAEATKERLQIGTPLELAMSSLIKDGFSCQPLTDRAKERGQPSFFCGKRIVEKRWWGLTEYHQILVHIDVDNANKIASANVQISWGGLRGL